MICWLEDQKIRELPVNEREPLRKYSENWNQEFQKANSLPILLELTFSCLFAVFEPLGVSILMESIESNSSRFLARLECNPS
jgi:hypothetical protein